MFKKGNKVYSEAGSYLKSTDGKIIGFNLNGDIEDFEEVELEKPLDIKVEGNQITINNKILWFIDSLDYATIKTTIIKLRYSNDDQIALVLNKDLSEEGLMYWQKMQEWRDWASEVATQIVEVANNIK